MYGVTFPMSQEAMSDNFLLPIGKAKVEREGSDVTLVAHSKMVGHSKDGTKVVRWVTPLSSKETVVVVQPPDLGTDVERAPNRVELVVRSGNLRAYGKGGWMPKESV